VGNVGAGFGSAVLLNGESGRGRLERWGKELTSGPRLSARGREGEGRGWPTGPRPRKGERGSGGGWAKKAERRRGGFLFLFQTNFKCIYNLNFEQIFFYKQKFTQHKINVLQHECIKNVSNLILNFYLPKFIYFFLYFNAHKIDSINLIQLF
jgi:hypothetical protein